MDCNNDGTVTVDELLAGINIVLGQTALDTCDASDANHDGTVTIHEVVSAVKNALTECP